MVAREYREFITYVAKLEVEYEECPFYCKFHEPKYDIDRVEMCKQCPRKKQRDIYDRQCSEALNLKLGSDHGFSAKEIERTMHLLMFMQPLGEEMIYKNFIMLQVVKQERD